MTNSTHYLIISFFRNNKSISFFLNRKRGSIFHLLSFDFFFHAGPHLSGGNCWHAHVVLWVSWFIQPKISPSSFSLSIRMIISFSIKFSKDGSGKYISPGNVPTLIIPAITQRRAHKVTENEPREKHVRIFFWQYRRKNIFPVSNRWRKKKRREKQKVRIDDGVPFLFIF